MDERLSQLFDTSKVATPMIAERVNSMIKASDNQRSNFERKWYDNNLFDDGYHFRYVERTTNRIVDLNSSRRFGGPIRAIPKASKQIRGIANLLLSSNPFPVVYPEKISRVNYQNPQEYEQARKQGEFTARRIGHWIQEEWKDQDLLYKLAEMIILAEKHGISYLQVWPDAVEEKIKTRVYDAFDIRLDGSVKDLQDSPYIVKSTAKNVGELMANENFDQEQLLKVQPDNRKSNSRVKDAYMAGRFGKENNSENASTVILNEAYIKEYLNSDNRARIRKQDNAERILEGKKNGDPIMRHVFTTNNGVWLLDEYLPMKKYPFVAFMMEPGYLYKTALIERFIPTNKSYDQIMSRIEKYIGVMVHGSYSKRKGESFKLTNQTGQVYEYENTPPIQNQIASIPAFVFQALQIHDNNMKEQGVAATTTNDLPSGVKSGVAIEAIKESEYSSLIVASRMLEKTVKEITEAFIELAHDYFITPQTVFLLEQGEPQYFDVIGQRGVEIREKARIAVPEDVIPIKREYKVDIEIENGLGFTREGQIARGQQLANYMLQLAEVGVMPKQAMIIFVRRLLEIFKFGGVAELMESLEDAQSNMTDEDMKKMKLALMQVLSDVKKASEQGEPSPQQQQRQRVDEAKLGAMQAMSDVNRVSTQGGGQNAS